MRTVPDSGQPGGVPGRDMAGRRHRVVIVGSGFGGLFAARALRGAPVDVTLIDRVNHHLFQPLLYQVATGILPEGEVPPATRDVLRRSRNVRVQLAEVTEVDVARRVVVAEQPGRTVETPYDSLVVATGPETSSFGHDELSRFAPGLKSIGRSTTRWSSGAGSSTPSRWPRPSRDPTARPAWLTFVVVGGGPTGVEMAAQILELSRRALRGNFRVIDPATARVLVVEGTGSLLPGLGRRDGRRPRRPGCGDGRRCPRGPPRPGLRHPRLHRARPSRDLRDRRRHGPRRAPRAVVSQTGRWPGSAG